MSRARLTSFMLQQELDRDRADRADRMAKRQEIDSLRAENLRLREALERLVHAEDAPYTGDPDAQEEQHRWLLASIENARAALAPTEADS